LLTAPVGRFLLVVMGRVGRRILDFGRAGALAAGTAFLLGVWFQGMARLGFRGFYPDGLADFLIVTAAGVAAGATLGFAAPAAGALAVVGRVAGTAAGATAIGGAFAGLTAVLVKVLDVSEGSLPLYFVPVGLGLVAVGLRRIPRSRAGRIALGVPVALLLLMRLGALWPAGAHAITRLLFPLPAAVARAELEKHGWGPLAIDDRTRIVAFDMTPAYHTDVRHLESETTLRFTLEVAKPYFEDACGDVHSNQPEVPPWVLAYPDRQACLKEHPPRREVIFEMVHRWPSPCCLYQVKQRRPGERIATRQTWPFVFHRFAWTAAR